MGAYCPAPLGTPELLNEIEAHALVPTVHAMKRRRMPFRGVLYAGVMVTNQGMRILEYNCRFGDPETQPVLMRLKTDLSTCSKPWSMTGSKNLAKSKLEWDPRPAVCVVMASQGYPGNYPKGKVILGLEEAAKLPDVKVFHAGTKLDANGLTLTDGGRVLGVTALGDTLADAKRRAYEAVGKIHFQGAFYRKDIGDKALKWPVTNSIAIDGLSHGTVWWVPRAACLPVFGGGDRRGLTRADKLPVARQIVGLGRLS